MRRRLSMFLAALSWPLLAILMAPAVQSPLAARLAPDIKPIRSWRAVASWYGEDFHGRTTASGSPFDMYAATAAHPSLPLGSLVRIVNPKNGRSQLARINDRGPYVDGRELDMSYLVASRLGLVERGVAAVRIELLEVPPRK